jgi:DNA-directed RNA polymerase subunit RPC12/RpoP
MECPHCKEEIPGKSCAKCGTDVPLESHYCMHCGAHFEEVTESTPEQDGGFDLESRILCPDGTCTGIIINGKCTECGDAYKASEKKGDEQGID